MRSSYPFLNFAPGDSERVGEADTVAGCIVDRTGGSTDRSDEGVHAQVPAKVRVEIGKSVSCTRMPDGNNVPPQTQKQIENERQVHLRIDVARGTRVDTEGSTQIVGHPYEQPRGGWRNTFGKEAQKVPQRKQFTHQRGADGTFPLQPRPRKHLRIHIIETSPVPTDTIWARIIRNPYEESERIEQEGGSVEDRKLAGSRITLCPRLKLLLPPR
jgi:hypothetical protein